MTMPRLNSHIFVQAILRMAAAAGDFAAVENSGDKISGTILLHLHRRYQNHELYEVRTGLDGKPSWQLLKSAENEDFHEISDYSKRRAGQDPDLWVVELNIASDERLAVYLELTP